MYVFPACDAPFPTTVPWLYFRRSYLLSCTSNLIYSFILTSKGTAGILAVFHCAPDASGWTSPASAPFGGILPLQPCNSGQLIFLLACVREWVSNQGGTRILIKAPPFFYAPLAHHLCHQSYLYTGFLPNHTYSNHYIPIADSRFDQTIEPAERRRLAKGKLNGIYITLKPGVDDYLTESLLQQCYHAHGYKHVEFGHRIRCKDSQEKYLNLICWFRQRPVAAAIIVWASDYILYHFRSGYLPEFRTLSPSLMLFEAAFEYGRSNGAKVLDMGISIDHYGAPKPSLSSFKTRIGGLECEKIVYQAQL